MPIGYPRDKPGGIRRKPLSEVATRDRWGNPMAGTVVSQLRSRSHYQSIKLDHEPDGLHDESHGLLIVDIKAITLHHGLANRIEDVQKIARRDHLAQ